MWKRLGESILKNRIVLLLIILVGVAFMGYKGKDVELAFAGAKVLPVTDPAYVAYNQFKKQFGEDGTMLVLGIQTDKIFEKDFYNDWYQLGNDIDSIEGISNVLSVAHAFELTKDTTNKVFKLNKVFKGKVETQEQCDSIKEKIIALPFYRSLLYNVDSNSTLMAVSYDKNTLNKNKCFSEFTDGVSIRCRTVDIEVGAHEGSRGINVDEPVGVVAIHVVDADHTRAV